MKHAILRSSPGIVWTASLLAILALSGFGVRMPAAIPQTPTPVVQTSNGPIRGLIEREGLHVFRGVRYGAPPVGELRFKPPRKPAPWTAVADAYQFGDRAIQGAGAPGGATDAPKMSEDCLFLNVWTPGLDNKKRPVMVWLHGGGFSSGSGGDLINEGSNLARKGDVVARSGQSSAERFRLPAAEQGMGPGVCFVRSGRHGRHCPES